MVTSSTPSSPPPLYSTLHPPRTTTTSTSGSSHPPTTSTTATERLGTPFLWTTPPCSPPTSPQSSFLPSLSAPAPTPHPGFGLSPPPEKHRPLLQPQLQPQREEVQVLPPTFMGKKGSGAKKKVRRRRRRAFGWASSAWRAQAFAEGCELTTSCTGLQAKGKGKKPPSVQATAPAAVQQTSTGIQWSTNKGGAGPSSSAHTTTVGQLSSAATHGYGSGKHKSEKHKIDYAHEYEEEYSDGEEEQAYYHERYELDERRVSQGSSLCCSAARLTLKLPRQGRSTRPRLLWRSALDPLTLGVLDSHVVQVRGSQVPRLQGGGSVDGKKWSRELEKCGL